MDYVQEMYSVLNDSNLSLEGEEGTILSQFSDETVGFIEKTGTNYTQNADLKNALHKLIDSNLFLRYLKILLNRESYSFEKFYNRMDIE